MKSERLMRDLAYRWCVVAILALLGCLACAPVAYAQAQAEKPTFVVIVPTTPTSDVVVPAENSPMTACVEQLETAMLNGMIFELLADNQTIRNTLNWVAGNASGLARRQFMDSVSSTGVPNYIIMPEFIPGDPGYWSIVALSRASAVRGVWQGNESSQNCASADPCACLGKIAEDRLHQHFGYEEERRIRSETASLVVVKVEPDTALVGVGGLNPVLAGEPLVGIEPGNKQVWVQAEGYDTYKMDVVFKAGEEVRLGIIKLVPRPATLAVTCNVGGASILVKGKEVGKTLQNVEVEVKVDSDAKSDVMVTVQLNGYASVTKEVSLTPGGRSFVTMQFEVPLVVVEPPKPVASGSGGLFWGGLAFGVAAASGMAAVCGSYSGCTVATDVEANVAGGLRVAAIGGFVLAGGGLLWRWFSDDASGDGTVTRRSVSLDFRPSSAVVEVSW